MSQSKIRYNLLDEIRGFMVLCMVFFHGFYLGGFIFGIEPLAELYYFFLPAEPLFAAGFIFICGLCTCFSRSNIKRGCLALGAGLAVTLVTYIMTFFGMNELIVFGILHFLGCSLLISVPLKKPLARLPAGFMIGISVLLFFVFYYLPEGYFGIGTLSLEIPEVLYSVGFLTPLGFPSPTFSAGDYFPIIPWIFIFFAGAFTANKFGGRLPDFFIKSRIKPLSFLGKNALLVYVIHQPLWYGIFYFLSLIK